MQKKKIKRLNRDKLITAISGIAISIVTALLIVMSCNYEAKAESQLYFDVPLSQEVQDHIFKVCEEYGVKPEIVVGIIDRESKFKASAIGDNGSAFGLMQVRPKYHSPRMEKLSCTDLLNAKQNITVGVDYLAELIENNGGNIEKALISYNAGPTGAKDRFFSKGIYSNEYSKDVLQKAKIHKEGMKEMFYSDNPVKDAERYIAEKDRQLQQLPVCSYCDSPVQGDYFYEIEGEIICEECLNDNFRKNVEDFIE